MFDPKTNILFFNALKRLSIVVLVASVYSFINCKTDDWWLAASVAGILLGEVGFIFGVLMPDEVRNLHGLDKNSE